ncbi:MAG: hypothetical protein WAW37_20280 [Syntrophobacteraceae bacterium]
MADMSEPRQVAKKGISNPDVKEIAADIEHDARILQESGRIDEATNLRNWARELRQKNVKNPF